mmetsp:Transcript_30880/g.66730  ORF Transcript_30880/g.66730 Transcript_30880/m.66730 type:complete len:254 (-) Transcript_30880:1087-1848(-)
MCCEGSFLDFHIRTFGVNDQVFHQSPNASVQFAVRALQRAHAHAMIAVSLFIQVTRRRKHFHGILNERRLRRRHQRIHSGGIGGSGHGLYERMVRTPRGSVVTRIQPLVLQRLGDQMRVFAHDPRGGREDLRCNATLFVPPALVVIFYSRSATHEHLQGPPNSVASNGQDPPRHVHPLLRDGFPLTLGAPHPRQYNENVHVPSEIDDQLVFVAGADAQNLPDQLCAIFPGGGLDVSEQLRNEIDQDALRGHEL